MLCQDRRCALRGVKLQPLGAGEADGDAVRPGLQAMRAVGTMPASPVNNDPE
jgi:hypothetical protein